MRQNYMNKEDISRVLMSLASEENGTTTSPPASSAADPSAAKADTRAIEFLSNIDDQTWKSLNFADSLTVTSLTGKEIGKMKVTVEEGIWKGQPCYLVIANSDGIVDHVEIGTSVSAYIGRSLQTLEQMHHEYVKIPENPLDKKTLLTLDEDKYIVHKTIAQGQDMRKSEKDYTLDQFEGFISEGSNLLLQRLLIKSGMEQPVNMGFIAFDSEANLCTATYKLLDTVSHVIATKEVSVVGVERTLMSTEEPSTTWCSYYLLTGHLASRSQIGSQVKMKLTELPEEENKVPDNDKAEADAAAMKSLRWEEDMELYSRFLDRKAELADDHATYMRNHPELRAVIADFLQFVLLRKPDNVCEFAADFFSAFSTGSASGPSFARSSPPQPTSTLMP